MLKLTTASEKLFKDLVEDAANWNGQPLLDITKEQRGNLSNLKKNELLVTFKDEGCDWVNFTPLGKIIAKDLFGIEV